MNLLALFILPSIIHPLPEIMPFYEVNQREERQMHTWQMAIDHFKGTEAEKIKQINDYWNATTYHAMPIWQTPEEVFESRSGDCKDLAIAKYYSLRYIGIKISRLKLTVVLTGNQWHMVLVVDNQVLDNMNHDIVSLADVVYEPAYSVNEDNLWTLTDVK